MGPHHQRGERARARRLRPQECLRGLEARRRWPYQGLSRRMGPAAMEKSREPISPPSFELGLKETTGLVCAALPALPGKQVVYHAAIVR